MQGTYEENGRDFFISHSKTGYFLLTFPNGRASNPPIREHGINDFYLQNFVEKSFGPFIFRMTEEMVRGALLYNLS